ncbi:hypothetical protein KC614_02195 [candidate division WWE3 bacterium]|uniref:Uncharacterized protein n=1 Tax=candidate division WWE3 bacterium TaxID=2053526 RepID=A0A955RS03_UNCKA|nr:hypothetical protein [candidate division WWE3 bacterium]
MDEANVENINADPNAPTQINPSKKSQFILLATIIAILVLSGILAWLSYLKKHSYDPNGWQYKIPTPSITPSSTTISPTNGPILTPITSITPTPSIAKTVNVTSFAATLSYDDTLTEVDPFLNVTDDYSDVHFYQAGTVTAGNFGENDLSGATYYVIVTHTEQQLAPYAPLNRMYEIFKTKDGKSLLFMPYAFGSVFNTKDDSYNVFSFYLDGQGDYQSNIIYPDGEPVMEFVDTENGYYGITQSDNGNNFYLTSRFATGEHLDDINATQVDTIGGIPVYLDEDMVSFYMPNQFGLLTKIDYEVSILKDHPETSSYYILDVTWNSDVVNSDPYRYHEPFTCATGETLIDNVTPEQLKVAGTTSDGDNIYQLIDSANDEYTNKLYNEDYIAGSTYTYNYYTDDDETPYTFEEFLTHHPVMYWKDPFGRYIKFFNENFILIGGCAKPAIYLYPRTKTDVDVNVIPNGELTFSYPPIKDGWHVVATPSGDLYDRTTNEHYDYLWWSSFASSLHVPNGGVSIAKDDIHKYLDDVLSRMSLNDKEINNFNEYWVPKLQSLDSDYVYINFLFNNEVNQIGKLNISPTPDNVIRVFMLYKAAERSYNNEREFPKNVRDGFTAVEWGGGMTE